MTEADIKAAFASASKETVALFMAVTESIRIAGIMRPDREPRFMGAGHFCKTQDEAERVKLEIEPLFQGIFVKDPKFGGTFTVRVITHGESAFEVRALHHP